MAKSNYKYRQNQYRDKRWNIGLINNQISELVELNRKELSCLQYLSTLIDPGLFIPRTIMNMNSFLIVHILNEIVLNKRKTIFEFGSGLSTIYISALLKTLPYPVTFYSIDNDNDWLNFIKFYLKENNTGEFAELFHVPLVATDNSYDGGANSVWYSKENIQNIIKNLKIDLVIVDGPRGNLCPKARYPAVPFLLDKLASSFAIFLDDTLRTDEELIFNNWTKLLSTNNRSLQNGYGYIKIGGQYISTP